MREENQRLADLAQRLRLFEERLSRVEQRQKTEGKQRASGPSRSAP